MKRNPDAIFGDWAGLLPDGVKATAFDIMARISEERAQGKTIYPADENIFRALQLTPPASVRCVILGQDPYHEPKQANGLAFSVNPGIRLPPSLRNIYKELSEDMDCPVPKDGDLTKWAQNGILLLNSILTVEEGKALSHVKYGWQEVTSAVIAAAYCLPQPKVFLLWGDKATNTYLKAISMRPYPVPLERNLTYTTTHPSPLSANRAGTFIPAFIGSKPFSRANKLLKDAKAQEIDWSL